MNALMVQVRSAVFMLALMVVVTGLVYPLAITGVAEVAFGSQANGSLIVRDGDVVGSRFLGQSFVDPETGQTLPGYFRGRPSAVDYDASASGASNMGPTSEELHLRIATDAAIIREENNLPAHIQIPVDLVTASGSGLDPHISRAAAELQITRVAQDRDLPEVEILALVDAHTEGAVLGFFGEERVNVLELNLALDALEN